MVEKSILTVITDGFSHSCDKISQSDVERDQMAEQMSESDDNWRVKQDRYLIDPYSKKPYLLAQNKGYYDRNEFQTTQNLLDWISKTTGVTITGYFVFSKKADFRQTMYHILEDTYSFDFDATWRKIRKEGHIVDCHGYNKMFLTSATGLAGWSPCSRALFAAPSR